MTEPDNTVTAPPAKYASFNARIIASAIDIFFIMLVAVPIIDWLMNALFAPVDMSIFASIIGQPDMLQNPGKYIPEAWNIIREQHLIERSLLDNTLQCLFIAAYTLPFWFRYSSTPGKMAFRMEIQDVITHAPMTREQAVKRFLGYIVSFIPFSLGFFWVLFSKKRQGFHDMLAGTAVIVKPKKEKIDTIK